MVQGQKGKNWPSNSPRHRNKQLMLSTCPFSQPFVLSIADLGFHNHSALMTSFFLWYLNVFQNLVNIYFYFLFHPGVEFLFSIFQVRSCFETYTEWSLLYLYVLQSCWTAETVKINFSWSSFKQLTMQPAKWNSNLNDIILWEGAEQISAKLRGCWACKLGRIHGTFVKKVTLSCLAMRQGQWKDIPGKERGKSKSTGNGRINIMFKNRSKSSCVEHKVCNGEMADGEKLDPWAEDHVRV